MEMNQNIFLTDTLRTQIELLTYLNIYLNNYY